MHANAYTNPEIGHELGRNMVEFVSKNRVDPTEDTSWTLTRQRRSSTSYTPIPTSIAAAKTSGSAAPVASDASAGPGQ